MDSDSALKIEEVFGQRMFRLRGDLLHLVSLNEQLGTDLGCDTEGRPSSIVVVQSSGRSFGLMVDSIHESEEIVVKPLERVVRSIQAYAGTTILADGQVALILDIAGLGERARLMSDGELLRASRATGHAERLAGAEPEASVEYLVASIGGERRVAMKLANVDRLEEIDPATVEKAGTLRFVQYRGELLRLIDVGGAMGAPPAAASEANVLKAIVRSAKGSSYGLIVEDVLDIVEVPVDEKHHPSSDAAVESILVIGGHATEVIDEAWIAASIGSRPQGIPDGQRGSGEAADRSDDEDQRRRSMVQLCTFRLGATLYGVDVLDVQEVLMPQQRTPIPLSPPEFKGLLNLRGDTVLALDLDALLNTGDTSCDQSGSPAQREQMNVVICTSEGSLSVLVDEVGEVMDLKSDSREPCPSTASAAQRQVARGVFKLESDLLIHLDVEEFYRLVSESQFAVHQ